MKKKLHTLIRKQTLQLKLILLVALFFFNRQSAVSQAAGALGFDGVNDHMFTGDNNAVDFYNKFTFESWIYLKNYGYSTLVAKFEDDGNNRGWMVNFGEVNVNELSVILDKNGDWSNHIQWSSGFIPSLNTWYHIAVTFDGTLPSNNIKLYVNGTLNAQGTWTETIYNNVARVYYGGYDGPGNGINAGANTRFLNGKMDDIRLWNRALCQGEINQYKNTELSGTESGLVAYYKNNQGTIGANNSTFTLSPDATPNALTNTLTNIALTGTVSNWVAGTVAIGSSTTAYVFSSVSANNPTTCSGVSVGITPTGANTYSITGGSFSVAPLTTTVYTVSGMDINNCPATPYVSTVTTLSLPSLSVSPSQTICQGQTTTLTVSGANTYTWSGGPNTSQYTVSPGVGSNVYTVSGTGGNGCSTSSIVAVTVNICAGIEESQTGNFEVNVFPNPNYGTFYIKTDQAAVVTIYDQLGQVVILKELNEGITKINQIEFASGLYFVEVKRANSKRIIKLVVN